ncbi:hypothetical protein EDB82DRAFT_485664 [Fusarium venenatum]|uniref:uncharacterized protein n=1 Tax=Fusarium venenatum TaxID=56646 RepID=UPI001D1E1E98|nr:hypothetical protein EDB82DRAFT_485664 [Fusarium venenatum]
MDIYKALWFEWTMASKCLAWPVLACSAIWTIPPELDQGAETLSNIFHSGSCTCTVGVHSIAQGVFSFRAVEPLSGYQTIRQCELGLRLRI